MISPDHQRRFEEALQSPPPFESLCQLARLLRDEGVPQLTVYYLFAHFQQITDGAAPRYDAIVDTMDCIYGGPWSKSDSLWSTELTDEIIKSGRT